MFHWDTVVMDQAQVRGEVEQVIRWSEVKAVAEALRAGNRPRVGLVIDYVNEPPYASDRFTMLRGSSVKREKPYRVAIEQWHLDAAERMLDEAKAQPVYDRTSVYRTCSR
jgi:hypothetical protein